MMNNEKDRLIDITILDRAYKIKCTLEEEPQLRYSARYVDEQMKKVLQSGAAMNLDRIAVVTALNISNELLQLKRKQQQANQCVAEKLQHLLERLKNSLGTEEGIAV